MQKWLCIFLFHLVLNSCVGFIISPITYTHVLKSMSIDFQCYALWRCDSNHLCESHWYHQTIFWSKSRGFIHLLYKKAIQQTCTIQQFNLQATVEKEKPFFAAFRRNALCYAKSTMKLHLLFVAHKWNCTQHRLAIN